MFHRITKLKFLENTKLELAFQDGKIVVYDVARLFDKYPELSALEDRKLFTSGRMTAYGIRWNDQLDLSGESIYENGELVRVEKISTMEKVGLEVKKARVGAGMSQLDLSRLTGIDQGDISKIECGLSNPSISTLGRIAEALEKELLITMG